PLLDVLLQQAAHRIGDLAPTPIADRYVDQQTGLVAGLLLRLLEHAHGGVGQQVERTHRVHAPGVVRRGQVTHGVLDDGEQAGELVTRTAEVVGGQQPQRHDLDAAGGAPTEQVLDLVRTAALPGADVVSAAGTGTATV